MKLAYVLSSAISLITVAWLGLSLRDARQQIDHAKLDHDALLVRIAVLQGQVDKRIEEDRIDEKFRINRAKLDQDDDYVRETLANAKLLEDGQREWEKNQKTYNEWDQIQDRKRAWQQAQQVHDAGH